MTPPVALITGGSRGIGRACVRAFARAGWQVVFLFRERRDAAEALLAELAGEGLRAEALRCDITEDASVEDTVAQILARYHRVDALVNNAGISRIGLVTDLPPAEVRRVVDADLTAPMILTNAVLPSMLSRGSGAVVNISSMWGQVGASCEVAYSAAKAGLIGYTKALAKEAGPSGVRVNCVSPGVIDTDMNAELGREILDGLAEETPLGRIGTPEDVAEAVLFLCGERASFITGQVLPVNGGLVV